MKNEHSQNIPVLDLAHSCSCARHKLYQQGLYRSLNALEKAYIGTFSDINDFIDEKITDCLYARFFDAYTVNDSNPGFISFQVDLETIPRSGQFVYIRGEKGQIHVFKVTS